MANANLPRRIVKVKETTPFLAVLGWREEEKEWCACMGW